MSLSKGWRPDPMLRNTDFESALIVHTTLEAVVRLLRVLRKEVSFLPYTSPLWVELSRQVRKRDHNRCRSCGGDKTLNVHHIVKIRNGGTNLPDNLKTLCRKCHKVRHPEIRKAKYVS